MRYGSVCSGIEAATMAWHHMGWEPAFFSEIDPFPRAVLSHHYPDVPLHDDFTTIGENQYGSIELLVGGTPCQSFSVAGLRKGLDDDRGNLALEFIRLVDRKHPRWIVWENVPGVLSSNGGRDFGAFIGALAEIGYGFAYRVLDAQYFGVAQRRRRVFVVGYLGDWRRAAAVLFERESLLGNPAPSRETGEKFAPAVTAGAPFSRTENERVECDAIVPMAKSSHWDDPSNPHPTLNQSHNTGGIGASNQEVFSQRGAGIVPVTVRMRGFGDYDCDGTASTLKAHDYKDATDLVAVGFQSIANADDAASAGENVSPTLRRDPMAVAASLSVRRLTPTECERLQGFPDNFTQIPYRNKSAEKCPDGPRYKALGNSMAVPVMRWIGERIQQVDKL